MDKELDSSMHRSNNFDLIRLVAAAMVVFAHSFILLDGTHDREPLFAMTSGVTGIGQVAVDIFFVISGFLITKSFRNSIKVSDYALKRLLRIFPALVVLLLITAFVFGPLATTQSMREYFTNPSTYSYLTNVRLLRLQYDLPGVFTDNPYPRAVNGSLWTLAYEFLCYVMVALLGIAGKLKKAPVAILFFASFLPLPWQLIHPNVQTLVGLFSYFSAGMLAHLCFPQIRFKTSYLLISALVVSIATLTPFFDLAFASLGAYLIIAAGSARPIFNNAFFTRMDISYGLYIYAFPIQQMLTHFVGQHLNWWGMFFLSLSFSAMLALASWKYVEAPAMAWKKRLIA